MNFVLLVLSAVLTNNFITVKTYGICPFLGVSKNTIIAALVQMLEAIIRKISPSLYNTMGVYLPLITTNCAVLGVTQLFNGVENLSDIVNGATGAMNLGWSILYALFAGIGFTLVMVIMSGLREKLNCCKVSKSLSGFPVSMIAAAFICMAFTIFAQIKI